MGNKALVLVELNRYGEALGLIEKALQINPNDKVLQENKEIIKDLIEEQDEQVNNAPKVPPIRRPLHPQNDDLVMDNAPKVPHKPYTLPGVSVSDDATI